MNEAKKSEETSMNEAKKVQRHAIHGTITAGAWCGSGEVVLCSFTPNLKIPYREAQTFMNKTTGPKFAYRGIEYSPTGSLDARSLIS